MFAHASIVLSAYSWSGSQGPGARPSVDCTEGRKIPLDKLPVNRWTDTDRHSLAFTFTFIDNLWSPVNITHMNLNYGR